MIHRQFARRVRGVGLAVATTAVASLALSAPALADSPNAPDSPGMFVIGDQNLALGAQVTFWGAQWWQDNPLSTGLAPASFKGYAENVSATCGSTWNTDPGNSSDAPADLSGVQDMVVSSAISQDGEVISGDVKDVVQVAVDPGYAGDPGHPGTGTIVGYVCGPDTVGGGVNPT